MKQLYEPDWDALKNRPIVFIWIPKTAGTSAHEMIKNNKYPILVGGTWRNRGYTGQHASYADLEENAAFAEVEGEITAINPTIVTVVRNPYDWLVSYFHHHSLAGRPGGQEGSLGNWTSFKDFLSKFDSENFTETTLPRFMWGEGFMTEQLYDNQSVCKADVIIRFEHLQAGWGKTIQELVGCERLLNGLSLPHSNRGKDLARGSAVDHTGRFDIKRNYREYYTDELIEFVEKRFGKELSMYGYTIDGPTDDSIFIDPAKCHR